MLKSDKCTKTKKWVIERYASEEDFRNGVMYDRSEFDGNVMLNEGIAVEMALLTGGAGTAYSNANSYLGVGDSTTAEAATQTGLQAATNKTYKPMVATYPTISGQTVTWRAEFDGSSANYAWEEFTVVNASTDAGDNLNRKVSSQGTKTSGQVWTLDLQITFS